MFCKSCGKELESGSWFCPYCGATVEQASVNQPVSQVEEEKRDFYGVELQKEKPVSNKAKVFSVLGLVFAIIAIAANLIIYAAYLFMTMTTSSLAVYTEQSLMFANMLYAVAGCSVIPLGLSLTGLIVSIAENKKGFNAKKTMVMSIVALAIAAAALLWCVFDGMSMMPYVKTFYY